MLWSRIPRRVGLARPWRNWFLTDRIPPRPEEMRMHKPSRSEIQQRLDQPQSDRSVLPPGAHQSHHYLHLAAALGASAAPAPPRIGILDSEVDALRQRFGEATPQRPLLLGLNPGAEYGPAKRWPAERFIEAALRVHRQTGCHCWVFGGPADVPLARSIAEALEREAPGAVRCLAGETSLRELCAALKACDVVLTNDTGPMHLAAAVGTPVVVPFGSTSPELTGPGLPGDARHALLKSEAACAPCFLPVCPIDFRCMLGILSPRVADAVIERLQKRPGNF
jgi:heptosyltransferase-2